MRIRNHILAATLVATLYFPGVPGLLSAGTPLSDSRISTAVDDQIIVDYGPED
jgi:hypothetical protein